MTTATAFRKEFIEMVGIRPDEGEVLIAETKLKGADRNAIRNYISGFPEFKARYEDIIKRVYTISCDETPDKSTLEFFLKRFARPDYGPDNLADEIAHGVHADDDASVCPDSEYAKTETDDMLGFAKQWQAATGHKIDVYEFIRYYRERPDKAKISRVADDQAAALRHVDRVHRDYLGRGVTRDEFLERYMFEHDQPHFEAEVLATVLHGEEYRMEMLKHLQKSNRKIFGQDLHPDDLDYIFGIVRDQKSMLHGEGVDAEVIRTNDRLREITDAVNEVYGRILGRAAETDEARECVAAFRAYGPDAAKAELATRLYESLEFHDVIKERFRKAFEKKNGRKPKTREVYDALAQVLHKHASDMSKALDDV